MIGIRVQKLSSDAIVPRYANNFAAGLDLYALEDTVLYPHVVHAVRTGIAVEIPYGYEGQVRGRSGFASKNAVMIINAPGTVDCDYRGEIFVMAILVGVHHHRIDPFTDATKQHALDLIEPVRIIEGDRIAQLVISPVMRADIEVVPLLSPTERGAKGFGSTGR